MAPRLICTLTLAVAPAFAQLAPYRAKPAPPVDFRDSSRIDGLLRGGNLYLSLADAIALALENNLDVELQRLGPGIADSDVLRAKGGGAIRGIALTVGLPPSGLGGPSSPLLNTGPQTVGTSGSVPTNVSNLGALAAGQSNLSIGGQSFSNGPPIPSFDPTVTGQLNWQHQSTPQSTSFITGTNALVASVATRTAGVSEGFGPGTQVSLNFSNSSQTTNSLRATFSPYSSSTLGLNITQPLLRGFGMGLNRRYIRIAQNDRKVTGLVFRQQVIETVTGVIRLYYDLVALMEDVRVREQAVALAEKLSQDNQRQVEAGTLAPIELVRARAQIAASRQDLANSRGFAREQELVLKTVITRRGTADPAIRAAHVVPTDPIPAPGDTEVRPVQDLISEAFQNRLDLQAAALQIANAEISLQGSRNQLRPELDFVAILQNGGLAGQINPLSSASSAPLPPDFLGGFGASLAQVLRRNFPTYGAGLQLTLPLRNRVAQADVARDELQYRQTQIRRQQLENQVRLEVEDALISIERSRAAYEAAVQTRTLQEQSLDAEQKRYGVGLSTTFLVIQYQNLVAQARSTEAAARGAYAKARAALDRAIGATLEAHGVSIDQAYKGRLSH
ncbi:MAG: TolC family protein [Bryobacteraceae bacterium]|jgi:outer membrane protein TolC